MCQIFIPKNKMRKTKKSLLENLKVFRENRNTNLNILIECIAIIMIWRGIWNLLDTYIFPNHPLISNLICIGIGILILLMDDGKLWELQEEERHKKTLKEKNK